MARKYNPHGTGNLKIRGNIFWARWKYHGKVYERSTNIRVDMVDKKGRPCGRELAMKILEAYVQPFKLDNEADVLSVIESRLERNRQGATVARANLDGASFVLLRDLADMYRSSPRRNDITDSHLSANVAIINEFSDWLGPTRAVSTVQTREAAMWASSIWASGVTPNTYNNKIAVMRHAWSILTPMMRTESNPFLGITKKKSDGTHRRGITDEEYRKILEVAGDRYGGDLKMMVILGWNTGMRIGDCSTLTWKDIDFDSGFIRVVTQKTGQRVSIPMLPEFREALLAHKKVQDEDYDKARTVGWEKYWSNRPAQTLKDLDANMMDERYVGYVCPRMAERHFREKTLVCILMTKTFKKAGIETSTPSKGKSAGKQKSDIRGVRARPIATFHSLRHGLASRLAQAGVPEIIAKELLGHRSDLIHEHYIHVHEDFISSEFMKLGGAFTAKQNREDTATKSSQGPSGQGRP